MGFAEDRARGRYGSRYVLVAENPYVLWDAVEDWKRVLRQAGNAPIDVFRAPKIDYDKLLDIGATIPMFSEDRLVVVHDLQRVTAKHQDKLISILERFGDSTKVVLTAESVDKRKKLYKFLSQWGSIEEFPRIYTNQLPGWAQRIAGEFGWQLSRPAATLLASTYGNDLFAVRQTIERVVLYLNQRRRIEAADVELAMAGEGTHTVFLLLEAIADADLARSMTIIQSLFAGDDYPQIWLSALASLLHRLLKLTESEERNDQAVARAAGIHPAFLEQSRRQAAHFGARGLCAAIENCFVTEWAIKTSKISPRLGWELLIYRLCSRRLLAEAPLFDLESPKSGE